MDLPRRRFKKPRVIEDQECRECGGDVLHIGETDWGSDDDGNEYGWLADWECAKCGKYLSHGSRQTRYKDPEMEELYGET